MSRQPENFMSPRHKLDVFGQMGLFLKTGWHGRLYRQTALRSYSVVL